MSTTLLCGALPSLLHAAPQDGTVAAGSAQISANGLTTLIQQSTDRAAIDWRSFDVKANESVVFQQPSSSSVTLNRIHDQKPSEILGSITANGQVILSNPSGMIFGKDSRVDVAGLVATTAGISSDAFMNNATLGFGEAGRSNAKIINHGTITAKDAGLIALVAPNVENHGFIGARFGSVELAGADKFVVDLYGDGLLSLAVDSDTVDAAVSNRGTLRARAGQILLTAAQAEHIISSTVNLSGILDVAAARRDANGEVVLGDGVAGDVSITAGHVMLNKDARIYASGPNGGGQVHIGGGFQGGGTLPWAKTVQMDSGARIAANATKKGDGGEVVLWSEDATLFNGTINARGGTQGGNGGLIETSSKGNLGVAGEANASAPLGNNGEWLLDPRNVSITNAGAYSVNSAGETVDPGSDNFTILDSSISTALSNGNNVTITSGTSGAQTGNITLNGATITKGGGATATLTLKADGSILTSGTNSISSNTNGLNVVFWADANVHDPAAGGTINIVDTTINTNGGYFVAAGGADDGANITDIDGNLIYDGIAGDGRPDNFSLGVTGTVSGVRFDNSDLDAFGGDIIMIGRGFQNAVSSARMGVRLGNGSFIQTRGAGNIYLRGDGGLGTQQNRGVSFADPGTGAYAVDGMIFAYGIGGGSGTDVGNGGFTIRDGATIESAGVGAGAQNIILQGTGGNGTGTSDGLTVSSPNTVIKSVDGDIKLKGVGGSGTGTGRGLVHFDEALIWSQGTGANAGNIELVGIGGTATGTKTGLQIDGNSLNAIVRSTDGDIFYTGTGTGNSVGINFSGKGTAEALGDGKITFTGNAPIGTDIQLQANPNIIGNTVSTGDITFIADDITTTGTIVQTRGNIIIKPRTATSTIGISGGTCGAACNIILDDTFLATLSPDVDLNGVGSLIIGDSALGNGLVDIAGWDISGKTYDIEVHGSAVDFTGNMAWNRDNSLLFNSRAGNIILDYDFARNAGTAGDGTLTFKASGYITSSGTHNVTAAAGATSGKLHTIFWADAEAVPNSDGFIGLADFTLNTNNGDAIFGGGLDDGADIVSATDGVTVLHNGIAGDGRPDGVAWGNVTVDEGVALGNTDVLTGTGNIIMRGQGRNSATGTQIGVNIFNTSLVETGSGAILMDGKGGNAGANNSGVIIADASTIVRSNTGSITLNGTGGDAATADNHGIRMQSSGTVTSLDTATINLYGKGGSAGTFSYGTFIADSTVSSPEGDISITGVGSAGASNHGIRISNSNITSNGGADITISGTRGTGGNDFRIQGATSTIGGVNATGTITLLADNIGAFTDVSVQTQNNIIFKPRTEPTTIGISGGTCGGSCTLQLTDTVLATLAPDVDANGTGSLIIGDSADAAGTVDIAGWDISGKTYDVEVHGGLIDFTSGDVTWDHDNNLLFNSRVNDINIDRSFARNAGTAGDGTLTFKASGSITTGGSRTITAASGVTSGKLHTIFWSDAEAASDSDGYIALTNLGITSNNGDVILGGGLDNGADILDLDNNVLHNGIAGDGRPDGVAFGNVTINTGVRLNNADITAGTGNVIIKGNGWNSAGNARYGLNIYNGSQLQTTTGTLLLNGLGGNGTDGNLGINIQDAATNLTTGDGSIILMGRGGNGTGQQNYGLSVNGDADIISNGTVAGPGSIRIYGRGGTGGTQENYGINIRNTGTLISTDQHDIVIDGRAAAGSGIWNIGFSLASGADITSIGTGAAAGKITITGTGAAGTNQGAGVNIDASGTSVNAVDGDISITGVGGAGTGTQNRGIILENGADIYSTGDSVIALTGTRGDSNAATYDIEITGATIEIGGANATGNININANNLSFANHDIRTDANITIKPRTAASSIGVSGGTCGGSCVLNINDTSLATLYADDDANGTGSLIIGDSAAGTGAVDINGWNLSGLNYDVEVFGGTVDFTGAMAWNGPNDLTFTSRTGGIDIDQTFTKAGGAASTVTFNAAGAITQTSNILSTSGALNLNMDSDRDSAGAETITLSANSTTLGGNININDNAVLGANTALSTGAGDITFVGTLNGAHNLGITTTSDIVFGGIVGGGTRLAAVTVTGGDTVVATNFNAASYTQTAGTGAVSFNNGGLNTTGNIDIAATGAILGTYTGTNGKLYSSGAVNATVTFNALDINGTSATLLAGNIGAPGAADQTMANRISINAVSTPALVANPAYKFAGFTIGDTGAPPAGGGGGSGGGTTPPAGGGGGTTPPTSGGGTSGGGSGSGSGSSSGSLSPSFRQALIDVISAQDTVGSNPSFGFDEGYEDIYYGNAEYDYAMDGEYSNLNERDLEEELNEKNIGASKEDKKRAFKRKKLYRMAPELWRILNQ